MNNQYPSFEEILEMQNKLIRMQYEDWLRHDLFTFQFWLLVAILVAPWFLWWKLVDKKGLTEILLYGLVTQTLVTILDEFGCQLNLWEYRYDIEPLFPRLIPVNFTALPVTLMLVYQYFPTWKPYLAASVAAAAVFSFAAEPVLEWMNIYVLLRWEHAYSFPIYIALMLLMRWLVKLVLAKQKSAFR
ncbi:MAG: hypothetical protein K6T29_03785 [Peptococcaceae bacterium]|nr:hypothetical protein [Peptococcaceae bacterium]